MITNEMVFYGDIEVSLGSLPTASIVVLAQRGFSHVMGNEVSSKVNTWKGKNEGATADDIADITLHYRNEFIAKLTDGLMGVRVGTSRGTALDTIINAVTIEKARAILKGKATLPAKNDAKIKNVKGNPTREEFLAIVGKKFAAEIRATAEERLVEQNALGDGIDIDDLLAD